MFMAERSSELSCLRAHLYAADRSCLALECASTATATSPAAGGPRRQRGKTEEGKKEL